MKLRVALPIALSAGLLALTALGGSGAGAAGTCGGQKVTITGTPGNDVIVGHEGST